MQKILIVLLAIGISSCTMGDRENKRALGTLLGLGTGIIIGHYGYGFGGSFTESLTAASIAGASGAAIGFHLSERLLPHDREKLDSTAFNTLNMGLLGESANWGEESKGIWGTFTPIRDFASESGMPCREYVAVINLDKEVQSVKEVACLLESGDWQTMQI